MPNIDCPNCDKSVRVPSEVPAGRKVVCPSCKEVFVVPSKTAAAVVDEPSSRKGKRAKARRPEPDDDDFDDDDRPARTGDNKVKSGAEIALIALGGSIGLLIVIVAAVFVLKTLFMRQISNPVVQNQVVQNTPAPPRPQVVQTPLPVKTPASQKPNTGVTKTSPPKSEWKPDLKWLPQLTQTGTAGDYQISLFPTSTSLASPKLARPNLLMAAWKVKERTKNTPATLTITIDSNKVAAEDVQKDAGHVATEFTDGFSHSLGMVIVRPLGTEKISLGGIDFLKYKWSGTTGSGTVKGLTFVGADNGKAIIICYVNVEAGLTEAIVSTFRKRQAVESP